MFWFIIGIVIALGWVYRHLGAEPCVDCHRLNIMFDLI